MFAFAAVGSREMQQDLIENTYLSVLLTAFFFFSILVSRSQILDTGCGIFLLLFLLFLIGFFSLLGCELKANS